MKSAHWKACHGETHRAGGDHCGICAPRWEWLARCPDCGGRLTEAKARKTGTCKDCGARCKTGPGPEFWGATLLPATWSCLTCTRGGKGLAPKSCPFCLSEGDDRHGPRAVLD